MGDHHCLAGFHEVLGLVAKVHIAIGFGSHGIVAVATPHNKGSAPVAVAGCNDAVAGENEERDTAAHTAVNIVDTIGKGLALSHQKGHQLGRVGLAHAELGELLVLRQAQLLQLGDVIDARHRAYGKTSQMGIAHNGLGIRIADNSNAFVPLHLVDVDRELALELGVLNVVDVEVHHTVVDGAEAGTTGAEMRMVIGAIEKVCSTRLVADNSKKTAHDGLKM